MHTFSAGIVGGDFERVALCLQGAARCIVSTVQSPPRDSDKTVQEVCQMVLEVVHEAKVSLLTSTRGPGRSRRSDEDFSLW